ncbi:Protein of unknown function [Pricia antarctica]|uniref:Cytochrome c domain-containing protein n=1 Tax=Pricia antarctica TaxID=641691 RepID=A0A1G7CZ85_9FLAO|nr:DUF3365 domain-containing protein [Pricia antarctica]SDE44589.1 Protein of unknown function [Pricia antarctica]
MKQIILLSVLLFLASCKDKSKTVPIDTTSENEFARTGENHPGKQILETECYICHNPKESEESMIAPPMIVIKRHYIAENTTKDQFTEDLIKWVNDPETESKIPAAHKRFGAMPYIPYPDDAIAQVADYLYDYEVEKPVWFDAHFESVHGKGKRIGKRKMQTAEPPQDKYAKIGMEYALAAKGALGKNLMKAIQQNGTVGAVAFCNVKALPLTDSISIMKNAIIKRVSDKPRNPDNAADMEELGYIRYFKKLTAAGKQPKPVVKTENGEVDFYFPITTNAMCLQCHGKPNDQIQPATLSALKNLYPADKAVGYGENEVRGLWAINFDKESVE